MRPSTCPAFREAPRAGALVVRAAVLAAVLATVACGDNEHGVHSPVAAIVGTASAAPDGVQQITVIGDAKLRFDPSVLKAHPGRLRITLRTEGGTPHDLEVWPAKINTGIVTAGQQKSIEVSLSRGHYDFVCTFHTSSNMVGVIDVT